MMDLRQYDPAIARWTVIDPVDHLSLSPYNAFDNNPVFWADPSGGDSQSLNAEFESHWGKRYDEYGNYILPSDRFKVDVGFTNFYNDIQRGRIGDIPLSGPGAEFYSADEAAINFGELYNGYSIEKSLELGTIIYKLANGKFSYLAPVIGGGGMVDSHLVKSLLELLKNIEGAEVYADVHTHGSDPKGIREHVLSGKMISEINRFSGDTITTHPTSDGDIYVYLNRNNNVYGKPIKGYMIAPNGGLYFFDPSVNYGRKNWDGSIHYEYKLPIYSCLPSDPYQGKQRLNTINPIVYPNLIFHKL